MPGIDNNMVYEHRINNCLCIQCGDPDINEKDGEELCESCLEDNEVI